MAISLAQQSGGMGPGLQKERQILADSGGGRDSQLDGTDPELLQCFGRALREAREEAVEVSSEDAYVHPHGVRPSQEGEPEARALLQR